MAPVDCSAVAVCQVSVISLLRLSSAPLAPVLLPPLKALLPPFESPARTPPICSYPPPPTVQVFLSAHLPDARTSLRPGASEADIQALEAVLGISMPPALRVMYR